MVTLPWINASTAYQLLQCPQRWLHTAMPREKVTPESASPNPAAGAANVGTLVHRSVEKWINSGLWRDPSLDSAAAGDFRLSAESAGLPLGPTRILAAFMESRLPAMRSILDDRATQASAEEPVADEVARIKGKIDILCRGPDYGAVIDVKTGKTVDDEGNFLDEIRTQLAVYCWILRDQMPWPASIVADIKRGVEAMPISREFAESTVNALIDARVTALRNPVAIPATEICKFCSLRPVCTPHWVAVSAGDVADAIEGELIRAERGVGGQTTIEFDAGERKRLRVNANATLVGPLAPGSRMRAMRVHRIDPDGARWTASEGALIFISEKGFDDSVV